MSDPTPTGSRIARLSRFMRVSFFRLVWLIVLAPILAVSAYSLFWVARHFGVPPYIAIAVSTCFDGVALLSADYSLKYAQAGMSGSMSRTAVWVFAGIAAFLQTFHARLGNEPYGAWIMWATLPLGAVVVFEQHIRFERRKSLARAGHVYPAPLPKWGFARWMLFPLATLNDLRDLTKARSGALKMVAETVIAEFRREANRIHGVRERIEPAHADPALEPAEPDQEDTGDLVRPEVLKQHRERRKAGDGRTDWARAHSPKAHIRDWARAHPEYKSRVGIRGVLPADVVEAYYNEHPDERSG
jgi:hypothetical protein